MPIELVIPKKKRQRATPDTREISSISLFNKFSTYPSEGLTPSKLTSICHEADQGDVYRQSELFEEMLHKDAYLFGLFNSRKLAVAKRDYEIVPADDKSNEEKEIADFVKRVLNGSRRWREDVENMLDAVPKGFSSAWIRWQIIPDEGGTVVFDRLESVKQKNFRFGKATDMKSDLNIIRHITDEKLVDGEELELNKWVIAIIKASSGYPGESALMRPCVWPYLFKNFGWKAFMMFVEKFGMPFIVGKWMAGAGTPEKEALQKAIEGVSTDSAMMISDTTSIEFPESSQKGTTVVVHEKLIEMLKNELSVSVLGHTGTSQSTPGKLGSEDAAQEVRHDLVSSDGLALDYIISDQLIKPLVFFNYGPRQKYPYYKTKIEEPKNLLEMAQVDKYLSDMGWKVPESYLTATYGRPIAQEGEAVLEPRQIQQTPFGSAIAKTLLGGKAELLR